MSILRDSNPSPTAEAIVAHLDRMTDAELVADFRTCVLPLAHTEHERMVLEAYFKARANRPRRRLGRRGTTRKGTRT